MNTSCFQIGIAPKLIRLATTAKSGAPTSTQAVAYHERQPESAMASNTPTNPTPAPRSSAVATNRACGSLRPPTRLASRTAHPGAPSGRGSGSTQSIRSQSTSAPAAMRDAVKFREWMAIGATGCVSLGFKQSFASIHSHILRLLGFQCRVSRPVHPGMKADPMTTRRQFVLSRPAFAVAANMLDNDIRGNGVVQTPDQTIPS
jgi:hypothetical protein